SIELRVAASSYAARRRSVLSKRPRSSRRSGMVIGDDRHYDGSLTRAVAFNEQNRLPGSQLKLASANRNSHARADNRADHVIGRVRRIVLMTKLDVRNHPLEHFHQI